MHALAAPLRLFILCLAVLGLFVLPRPAPAQTMAKMDLWTQGTQLRGANIWQSRNYGVFVQVGDAPVGPAFNQEDFDALSALGCNVVNISHPGLFDEDGEPDPDAIENLDHLLDQIQAADMFAVISFRTGPGRNEMTYNRDEVGDWFTAEQLDERVWTDQALQESWADMWRFTAERYAGHPIVAGYTLMVEPNANEVLQDRLNDPWDPEEFHAVLGGSAADWNRWHPALVRAVREVDPDTPILISPDSYGAAEWLGHLEPASARNLVADIHPYMPVPYVFQAPGSSIPWPMPAWAGENWGIDGADGRWLRERLDAALQDAALPVAAMEWGVTRCAPDAANYAADMAAALEDQGLNHAVWAWYPKGFSIWGDGIDVRRGPDLDDHQDLDDSELLRALGRIWAANQVRPSGVTFSP